MRRLFPTQSSQLSGVTTGVSVTADPIPHFRYIADPDDFARTVGKKALVANIFR